MNGFFNEAKKDKVISGGFLVTLILILLIFIYVLLNIRLLPPYIPLFNQLPWGEKRLGTTFTIFIPLGIAIFVAIFNAIILSFIYKKSQIISRMLAVLSILIAFLSFLFIIRTIQLIT
ncbi:MAG: hypothetical protein A3B44_00960 [Candidatus Levybacteria bacterium RIFCSPLOWO2_01_FULL_38_21]|nr:MAG: hypothetical protein A3B44_00960 [Candidatus Levybacteria bacterium RIFCSPLOWO2_01_FULL_38_21]